MKFYPTDNSFTQALYVIIRNAKKMERYIWPYMATYDKVWQLLATYDILWKLMATYSDLWQLIETYSDLWQLIETYGILWQLMATHGNLCQLMATNGNLWLIKATYRILWQLMATHGNMATYGNLIAPLYVVLYASLMPFFCDKYYLCFLVRAATVMRKGASQLLSF